MELEQPSESMWEKMTQFSRDMLCTFDRNGNYKHVSQACSRILGYESGEMTGRHFTEYLHPDCLAQTSGIFQEVLQGFKAIDFENRLIHRDGQAVPLLWSATWSEEEGLCFCVAKDITAELHAFNTIKKQAEKLNAILESITDAFCTIDTDWNFTFVNQEFSRLLKLEKEAVLGRNAKEIFLEEAHQQFYSQYHYALETGKSVHFVAYLDELDLWLQLKAFPSAEGLSIYFEDLTERVKSRQELEKLSLVASHTNNGVIITDSERRIEWVNEGFSRLTGYSLEEAVGHIPSDLLHRPGPQTQAFNSVKEDMVKGQPVSFEILNYRKSGEEIWFWVQVNPIYDEKDQLVRFVTVQTDITDLKKTQLELSELTKDLYRQNSDLQQFTYIVSHNLRAPVANALGLTDILTSMDKGAEMYEATLDNLKCSMGQLDTVIKDMNTVLSIRDSKGLVEQEFLEVEQVLQQALDSLQISLQACGGQVRFTCTAGPRVKAHKASLYSIFYNLLSNAIKYRSADRPLQIYIKCLARSDRGTVISFSDNGSGFDMAKARANIFGLYKRFHPEKKGRGIGLFLVKSYLEAMGGRIEVSSQAGAGTRFLIFFGQ